jgi:hypothetical protein
MKRRLSYALFYLVLFFVLSFAVMFLWNYLLPPVTHLPIIKYWQALGLMLLCRVLFGGFNFRGFFGRREGPPRILKDKLMTMDEADRAAFKEEWRKRCERRDSGKA